MSTLPKPKFDCLLDGTPLRNWGAKAFLAGRRTERRTPFIPITLFGFVLDEPGPEMMTAPLDEERGRCATWGIAMSTRTTETDD